MATLNQEGSNTQGSANAVLGPGTSFEGKLVFEGEVHIGGRFIGEIWSEDRLELDATAEVQAEIHAGTIVVYGNVLGNLHATQLIELKANAHVVGNIEAPSLVIERGVIFEGNCRMENLGQADTSPVVASEMTAAQAVESVSSIPAEVPSEISIG